MSDAPERIWAWVDYDGTWDGTWHRSSETLQPERIPDAEYVRADLATAAREEGYREGLEAAAQVADAQAADAQTALGMCREHEHAAKTACVALVKRFRAHAAAIRDMAKDQ